MSSANSSYTVAPSYSPEPGNNERRLDQAPHPKSRVFSGHRTKKSGRDTVVLIAHYEHADVPTYGPSALIDGSVNLEDRESVSKVAFEIKGTIEFMAGESTVTKTIFAEHRILWSMEHSEGATCPSTLPFATHLPAQFEYNQATYPLPPSYFVSSDGGVYAKIVYSLAVTVSRSRGRKLAFLSAKNTISIPFAYSPRTRPPGPPTVPPANFPVNPMSTSEQFHVLTLTARPRPRVSLHPVDVQLFTSTADVFPLGAPIPVHIQLTGPPDSLREFLPGAAGAPPRSRVEVRLLRQTTMLVEGHKETCRTTLGTAALVPSGGAQDAWDGELRCDGGVGSFEAGLVGVQDFIVLEVLDAAGPKSQFGRARQPRAICLVADPWQDDVNSLSDTRGSH